MILWGFSPLVSISISGALSCGFIPGGLMTSMWSRGDGGRGCRQQGAWQTFSQSNEHRSL